jgi:hypothetical protein
MGRDPSSVNLCLTVLGRGKHEVGHLRRGYGTQACLGLGGSVAS